LFDLQGSKNSKNLQENCLFHASSGAPRAREGLFRRYTITIRETLGIGIGIAIGIESGFDTDSDPDPDARPQSRKAFSCTCVHRRCMGDCIEEFDLLMPVKIKRSSGWYR
jgi:hypothetical protein